MHSCDRPNHVHFDEIWLKCISPFENSLAVWPLVTRDTQKLMSVEACVWRSCIKSKYNWYGMEIVVSSKKLCNPMSMLFSSEPLGNSGRLELIWCIEWWWQFSRHLNWYFWYFLLDSCAYVHSIKRFDYVGRESIFGCVATKWIPSLMLFHFAA